jgi:hypothetical protein
MYFLKKFIKNNNKSYYILFLDIIIFKKIFKSFLSNKCNIKYIKNLTSKINDTKDYKFNHFSLIQINLLILADLQYENAY